MTVPVFLITGQPGVGKTTTCRILADTYPEFVSLSFGAIILDEVRREHPSAEEAQLRHRVTALVTRDVLNRATLTLRQAIAGLEGGWALIDSHAVSQDAYGFRSTPDGRSYFDKITYSAIINLYLSEELLLQRLEGDRQGRHGATVADLQRLFTLQAAASTLYCSLSECPLYYVNAERSPDEVASVVYGLLTGHN